LNVDKIMAEATANPLKPGEVGLAERAEIAYAAFGDANHMLAGAQRAYKIAVDAGIMEAEPYLRAIDGLIGEIED
jgi:hypothetical protein